MATQNYALIQDSPLQFVRYIDGPTGTKAGYSIVPVINEAKPTGYDTSTHKLERTQVTAADGVTNGWSIVPLSTEEQKAATFRAAIEAGYDTGNGYRLALHEHDRNNFIGLLTLVNGLGAPDEATTTIGDIDGNLHSVTVAELKAMLMAYGLHYQAIWGASK